MNDCNIGRHGRAGHDTLQERCNETASTLQRHSLRAVIPIFYRIGEAYARNVIKF